MASQKHLKDLLQEDQEPFHLKSFISDRRCRIERPRTDLQTKPRTRVTQDTRLSSSFCRNACFFSLNQSPDPRKSPLFGFKSPNKNPNSIFADVPSRTVAVLLEAAGRIKKQSSDDLRIRTQNRGNAFGLFGSMLKKLKHGGKRVTRGVDAKVSVKDILTWDSPVVQQRFNRNVKRENIEMRLSCSCSESDGVDETDEFAFATVDGLDLSDNETRFCESPFRFVLETSSPGRRTPNFSSPATSPSRRETEKSDNNEVESLTKLETEVEDEEDKEQCSPVCVLETPFEDDDEDGNLDDDGEDQTFHLKPNHEMTRRLATNRLLQKLCKFDELTGLDPIELEQRISEEENVNDYFNHKEQHKQETETKTVEQEIFQSAFSELNKIPEGMKRLVYDLVEEEEEEENQESEEAIAKRICRRLDLWREVESNTIDMMVELDFRQEQYNWAKYFEEVQETVMEIEIGILGYLIHELSYDIVSF